MSSTSGEEEAEFLSPPFRLVEYVRFEWTIENFSGIIGREGEIRRKVFWCKAKNGKDLDWCFELKRRNDKYPDQNYPSLHLRIIDSNKEFDEDEIHPVDFSVWIHPNHHDLKGHFSQIKSEEKHLGFDKKVHRTWEDHVFLQNLDPSVLQNDQVTLVCDFSYWDQQEPCEKNREIRNNSEIIMTSQQIECADEIYFTCASMMPHAQVEVDSKFSDVKLLVGEKCFPSHKAILSARSKVFAKMFEDCDEITDKLEITDIKPEIFKEILDFIYTGNTPQLNNIDELTARDLLAAADRFDLKRLKDLIQVNLASKISSIGDAIDLLIIADSHSAQGLIKASAKFIVANIESVKKTESWSKMVREKPSVMEHIISEFRG